MASIIQNHSVTGLDTTDDKKSVDKEGIAGKLVKLRAFNIFASRVRDSIKEENPVANGHELKRIAGQKWAQLGNGFKQEFLAIAQNENDLIEKAPVDPSALKRRKRRRTKAETKVETDSGHLPTRPGKSLENDEKANGDVGNGVMPASEGQPKRRRMQKPVDADPFHAGNSGSGTLNGLSDAGYLVILRVGDTDMVFRGVLFDPSIAITPSLANEVPPGVKSMKRKDGAGGPPLGPASSSRQMTISGY